MHYTITNPASGAPIAIDGLTLEVGETKEFDERETDTLLQRYGFLVVELERDMFGAASEDVSSVVAAKIAEQEEAKRLAEEAKYCPHCKQVLPEFSKSVADDMPKKKKQPKEPAVGKKHGKHKRGRR